MAGASLGGNMLGATQQPMNPSAPLGTGTLQKPASQPGASFLNQAGRMLTQQQGNPQYSPGMAPGVGGPGGYQTSFNTGPAVNTNQVAATPMPVQTVGNASPYMKSMEDAYYQKGASRLDPQYQQRQQGLESQLSAMGLTRGSEAWTNEMDRMGRDRNDAYSGLTRESILNSGAEAQRAQGMDVASGNFANSAAQQDFTNRQSSIDAFNRAQAQGFNQNQAAAQFGNTALSDQQRAAQGWGALDVQSQASRNQLAGSLAGTEANRYGSDQQLAGANAQANATMGAAGLAADASRYGSDQQRLSNILNNETNRYGIDTTASSNKYGVDTNAGVTTRGQDINRDIAKDSNTTQRYGIDTGASTAIRGQDINRDIARDSDKTQRYGIDTGAATAIRGQDVTVRGQDQSYALGQGRLGLDTNVANAAIADNDYWRPIKTQQALGGNMVGNPAFGNPPGGTSGNTQTPPGAVSNTNGVFKNAAGQIWNAITGTWGG